MVFFLLPVWPLCCFLLLVAPLSSSSSYMSCSRNIYPQIKPLVLLVCCQHVRANCVCLKRPKRGLASSIYPRVRLSEESGGKLSGLDQEGQEEIF
jgi:hypothetical protein